MSDEAAVLRDAVREELAYLWNDLNLAQSYAYDGKWSMRCDSLEGRIKALTPLVGATPWEDIQIALLENGVYRRIHADLGITVEPDMERIAVVRANYAEAP